MDIATHLISQSVVSAIGTDVSIGRKAKIPDGDGIISIVETGGSGTTETHDRIGNPYENPSASVTIRHTNSSSGRALAVLAWRKMNVRNITINGVFYLWIRPVQSPFDLGVDEKARSRWTFNLNARKTLP
jgi:hypothetical protein